jgi:hypothetical protein
MDNEKHVDESWKDNVAKEKDLSPEACGEGCSCDHGHDSDGCGGQGEMEVNFFNYILSMSYQAMIFLGEVPNPVSGQSEKNLRQAKFLIDTLSLLKDKTRGNLTPEEENILSSSLYELQMKYVELSKNAA